MLPKQEGASNKRLLLAALSIAGAFALLLAALWSPKTTESSEWQPLNEQVAAALQTLDGAGQGEADGQERVSAAKPATDAGAIGQGEAAGQEDIAAAKPAADAEQIAAENAVSGDGLLNGAVESSPVGDDRGTDAGKAGLSGDTDFGAPIDQADDGRLDINRATVAELDALKGIGPAKAAAIVADRELNGKFKSTRDLLRVKGIGQKLLTGMEDSIVARP
jgi:competence protein ComEA